MASGGAKNIVLIVIAVGAIAGAAYLLSQSMGGGGTIDQNERVYFVKVGTETSASPVGVTMTMSEYQSRIKNRSPILIDGSDDVLRAGKCPDGHFYPLGGHADQPEFCTAEGCGIRVQDYDLHGNPQGN